jgi:hypothetical protein
MSYASGMSSMPPSVELDALRWTILRAACYRRHKEMLLPAATLRLLLVILDHVQMTEDRELIAPLPLDELCRVSGISPHAIRLARNKLIDAGLFAFNRQRSRYRFLEARHGCSQARRSA